jgi:hypothetical protein
MDMIPPVFLVKSTNFVNLPRVGGRYSFYTPLFTRSSANRFTINIPMQDKIMFYGQENDKTARGAALSIRVPTGFPGQA